MNVTPALMLAAGFIALLAGVLGVVSWRRPNAPHLARMAGGAAWLSLLFVLGLWIARWIEAGHLPIFGTFESALSIAAAVLLIPTLFRFLDRIPASATPGACLVAAAVLFHGRLYDPTPYALTISERSWVVDIHAIVAWFAFGMLAVNAGYAAWLLLRKGNPGPARPLTGTLTAGFLLHSAMLATGSLYKFLLFGVAWSFDPIETLGFAAWCAYGTLLHMHLFAKWDGRKLAGWCLTIFVLLVVSYRGIVWFPVWSTYHIFDMDMRIHLTGSEQYEEGERVD
ncbi:MAG: cytochrome c biogenesis protein CcsA [Acidobacteria bacterium]|uniref:Cytochrome c biogenesis protein CcsA n=1 Tax=Candidatus Polarisedimenticola svalbardensis TaxID=2886004 RepID=A0A8J6XWS8_9BACT|nr:cytochrome c biogenesis protein CcsA [Candidatus Polarisedimenticola svalbardensis]